MTGWIRLLLAAAAAVVAVPVVCAAPTSPQAAVGGLLAIDRAFSAASAKTDLVTGLSAMFADDVVIPMPPGQFVNGGYIAE